MTYTRRIKNRTKKVLTTMKPKTKTKTKTGKRLKKNYTTRRRMGGAATAATSANIQKILDDTILHLNDSWGIINNHLDMYIQFLVENKNKVLTTEQTNEKKRLYDAILSSIDFLFHLIYNNIEVLGSLDYEQFNRKFIEIDNMMIDKRNEAFNKITDFPREEQSIAIYYGNKLHTANKKIREKSTHTFPLVNEYQGKKKGISRQTNNAQASQPTFLLTIPESNNSVENDEHTNSELEGNERSLGTLNSRGNSGSRSARRRGSESSGDANGSEFSVSGSDSDDESAAPQAAEPAAENAAENAAEPAAVLGARNAARNAANGLGAGNVVGLGTGPATGPAAGLGTGLGAIPAARPATGNAASGLGTGLSSVNTLATGTAARPAALNQTSIPDLLAKIKSEIPITEFDSSVQEFVNLMDKKKFSIDTLKPIAEIMVTILEKIRKRNSSFTKINLPDNDKLQLTTEKQNEIQSLLETYNQLKQPQKNDEALYTLLTEILVILAA